MKLVYLLPGVLIAGAGFVVLFALLSSVGALAKSKQLSAIGELASGRAGRAKRVMFFLALAAMGLGACGAFAGVSVSDSERRHACERNCKERGYAKGTVGGSSARDAARPSRHAFVACACEGGPAPDPLEFPADQLSF